MCVIFSVCGNWESRVHCPAGHIFIACPACSEAQTELFIAIHYFLAISVSFSILLHY